MRATSNTDLAIFQRTFGTLGEAERRSVPLTNTSARNSGTGDGRLKLIGHASVFSSPSVAMSSPLRSFTEYVDSLVVAAANRAEFLRWDDNTDAD